jgi:uncharacterized membrane protein
MTFEDWMQLVVRAFELVGVLVLVVGAIAAAVGFARTAQAGPAKAVRRFRSDIGRSILLGLEILIVADIVQTVTIDPTIESALTLGIIVLVRTFLSFSIEIELDGVPPWRRRETGLGGTEVSPSPETTVAGS